MYKLIIVDDEELICRGLSELMEWSEMGFELSTTLDDGRDAIEYLQKESVDVVFTDIKMTDISGLEVAKYVYEHVPQTKVVLISGYREFDYAQKALEYDVVHYLLKPTQFDEIERVFKQIKQELDKERETHDEVAKFKERDRELIPLLQEQFFIDLFMGALKEEDEVKRRIDLIDIGIDPYHDHCFIFRASMDEYKQYFNKHWEYSREKLDTVLKNHFNSLKEGIQYFILLNYEGEIKIIALSSQYDDKDMLTSIVLLQIDNLMKTMKSVLGLELNLTLEQSFQNIFELSNYSTPYFLDRLTIDVDDKLQLDPSEYMLLINKYKLFMSIIYDGDTKAVSSLVDSFFSEMKNLSLHVIHHVIIDMFAVLTNQFMELGTDIWGVTRGKVDYHHIVNMKHVESIKIWCESVFIKIIIYVNKNKNATSDHVITKALEYMEHNYQQNISLDDVADRIFLNPVYFSRLFKQTVGENFTHCLTKIRIEKAKELLLENRYKTYEVSKKVGYSNCKYFTRVFKQFTGYTTTEYVKLVSRWGIEINE